MFYGVVKTNMTHIMF